jgi:hypothetical protein
VILIRLLLNFNCANVLDLQMRTALEEVAADEAEVTDAVETVEIEVIDEVEVVEEVLWIVADMVDVVDLVEADID